MKATLLELGVDYANKVVFGKNEKDEKEKKKRNERHRERKRPGMDIKSHQFSSFPMMMMMMILFSIVYTSQDPTRWGKRGPV